MRAINKRTVLTAIGVLAPIVISIGWFGYLGRDAGRGEQPSRYTTPALKPAPVVAQRLQSVTVDIEAKYEREINSLVHKLRRYISKNFSKRCNDELSYDGNAIAGFLVVHNLRDQGRLVRVKYAPRHAFRYGAGFERPAEELLPMFRLEMKVNDDGSRKAALLHPYFILKVEFAASVPQEKAQEAMRAFYDIADTGPKVMVSSADVVKYKRPASQRRFVNSVLAARKDKLTWKKGQKGFSVSAKDHFELTFLSKQLKRSMLAEGYQDPEAK